MQKAIIAVIGFMFMTLVGCQSNSTEIKEAPAFDPTILDEKMTDQYGKLIPEIADSASALYMKSYRLLGKDSLAPFHLMKSADIQRNISGKALMAIKKYDLIKRNYPDHMLAGPAYFMIGLTFDQNLHDKERASLAYLDFLQKYPNHPMAAQASDLLLIAQDSGTTDIERVHEWME